MVAKTLLRGAVAMAATICVGCGTSAPRLDASTPRSADLIVRNGVLYDGSGGPSRRADLAVRGDRVVRVGDLTGWTAKHEVDAHGLAVAPGFVNMLSWSDESLIYDGRGLSELKQGVTLEVMGEGWTPGPVTPQMKETEIKQQADFHHDIPWTTLGEYLEYLEKRGVSMNVASFVGATTVRLHELGAANRAPTPEELGRMQDLVRQAMQEGALGVGSALIYAPGNYAQTDELKALVAAAAEYGGGYISHMRNEGDKLLEAIDELIDISRSTGVHAELYHFKAAGHDNWKKMAQAIHKIEQARAQGLPITANMYTYTAGGTGISACIDPALQEGGTDAFIERLQKPDVRKAVVAQIFSKPKTWENICHDAHSADRIVLAGFKEEKLKPLTGKTLAEIARMRGKSAAETVVDLVIEDHSNVGTIFFLMSEDNVKLGLSQPWVSLGSDEQSQAPEGMFLKSQPHPRAYGNFARFLGKYVRDEKVDTLSDAIRRLTSLPAENWKLVDRGCLHVNCYADLVIFDPATIIDHATFPQPAQFATGVRDVFVNGKQVLKDGEPTAERPGRVVRGPGYRELQ